MPQSPPSGESGIEVPATGDLAKYDIQRRIGSGKFSVVYRAKRLADKSSDVITSLSRTSIGRPILPEASGRQSIEPPAELRSVPAVQWGSFKQMHASAVIMRR